MSQLTGWTQLQRVIDAEKKCEEQIMYHNCFHNLYVITIHCRWNKWKYDQWWEVKFVGEGIIDQGGGFRDSLAELSDELCPAEEHITDVLPYLIRTPNNKVHRVSLIQSLVKSY